MKTIILTFVEIPVLCGMIYWVGWTVQQSSKLNLSTLKRCIIVGVFSLYIILMHLAAFLYFIMLFSGNFTI